MRLFFNSPTNMWRMKLIALFFAGSLNQFCLELMILVETVIICECQSHHHDNFNWNLAPMHCAERISSSMCTYKSNQIRKLKKIYIYTISTSMNESHRIGWNIGQKQRANEREREWCQSISIIYVSRITSLVIIQQWFLSVTLLFFFVSPVSSIYDLVAVVLVRAMID